MEKGVGNETPKLVGRAKDGLARDAEALDHVLKRFDEGRVEFAAVRAGEAGQHDGGDGEMDEDIERDQDMVDQSWSGEGTVNGQGDEHAGAWYRAHGDSGEFRGGAGGKSRCRCARRLPIVHLGGGTVAAQSGHASWWKPLAVFTERSSMAGYSKGLEGVIAAETRMSFIDGEKGILEYVGIPIGELASNSTFEETVFLLWNLRLPSKAELAAFTTTDY